MVATWALEHLIPGKVNLSLTGDLLEEMAQGRSSGWYWQQVLLALLIGYAKQVKAQWPALVFAALWSGSAPALLLVQRMNERFEGQLWQMSWPWSTVCALGFSLGLALLYLWTGLLLYVAMYSLAVRRMQLPRIAWGIFLSVPLFAAAMAAMTAVVSLIPNHSWIDLQQMTYVRLIAKPVFIPYDIAFCIPLAIAICAALPRTQRQGKMLAR
jgi:hypothetical protein